MQSIIIDVKNLGLPPSFIEKFGSHKVLVKEVKNGILLSPVKTASNLRGSCKGKISTKQYFEQKKFDKEFEK